MKAMISIWRGVVLLVCLSALPLPAFSQSKGVLEILRDKGILTEEEYRQAVEETQQKDKKVLQDTKTEV